MTEPSASSPATAAGDEAPRSEQRYGLAVRWAYLNQFGRQLTSLIISLVLAALLGPKAFGIVALAAVFLAIFELIIDQSASQAVIQRPQIERAHLDSAFWSVMAMSIVMAVVAAATAPIWASIAKLPELTNVIRTLALTMPLSALATIQVAVLKRAMNFRAITIREMTGMWVSGVAGVVAAIAGLGLWALVVQMMVHSLVDVAVLWTISPWRPRFAFSLSHAQDLLPFSFGAVLNGLGVFLNSRVETILIGVLLGPVAVSVYRLASRLVNVVVDLAIGALGQVALPVLSELSGDEFRDRATSMLRQAAVFSCGMLAVVAAGSLPLTRVLGDEWSDAFPTIPILALAAAFISLSALISATLQALGRAGLSAARSWAVTLVSGVSLLCAALWAQGRGTQTELLVLASTRILLGFFLWAVVDSWLFNRWARIRFPTYFAIGGHSIVVGGLAAVAGILASGAVLDVNYWLAGVVAGVVTPVVFLLGFAATDSNTRELLGRTVSRATPRRRSTA
jgi:O-antigen/teichoic acid export membrane protein